MSSPFTEGAPDLARRGFKVFQLRPRRKTPLVRWRKGSQRERATADPVEVARRARYACNANVGIATGELADGTPFAVLDIDPEHGGTRPDWAVATLEARTPSGGVHCYYRTDGIVRNSAGQIAPGVDVRGEGGMVVAPPSVTGPAPGCLSGMVRPLPERSVYRWTSDPEAPMAFVPAERFHEFTAAHRGAGTGPVTALRKRPEDVRLGEVHNQLMSWASWLASRGYEQDEAEEFLREFAGRIPEPLDMADTLDDVEKCVAWVYEREAAAA